jgi:predicted transcriptional regulator of viral defense system
LAALATQGWLSRPARGFYVVVPLDAARSGEWTEDPWVVAARLFPEGYLGGWTACEHWGLTDQVFREILVFTPRRVSRTLDLPDAPIRARTLVRERLFGIVSVWRRSVRVRISSPSRTIVDLLDDPATGGGIRHVAEVVSEYFGGNLRDDKALLADVDRLGNRTVYKRLGYLIDARGIDAPAVVAACRSNMSTGITALDPALDRTGPVSSRWRLRVNASVDR